MTSLAKGAKAAMSGNRVRVQVMSASPGATDLIAVLHTASGRVRSDADMVFFNNPSVPGVALTPDGAVDVDLTSVPTDIDRVVIAASTDAQGLTFGAIGAVSATVVGDGDSYRFDPPGLTSETLLLVVAFYRRAGAWKIDAIGQGYAAGLAAFATESGITVDDEPAAVAQPVPQQPVRQAPQAPQAPAAPMVDMRKVRVSITKESATKTAKIDLRKSGGDPSWVLTVGLEWDGRGAKYRSDGSVKKYGEGDLDVYFYCRNEETNEFVVLSGEYGHTGGLQSWPFIFHHGDSRGPGAGGVAAVEQVTVLPRENGDLLVNVYQSVDNGTGAIDTFGRPRVVIRYGRAGMNGMPGPDADEIAVYVGDGSESYWATVAHIDVVGGVLKVDGETRYSLPGSEMMPTLDRSGRWIQEVKTAPVGRSKNEYGTGLDNYWGRL